MIHFAICLLVLVSLAGAHKGDCYSKGKYFKDGEEWTEPPCNRRYCRQEKIGKIECPQIRPGPGCVPAKGKPGASYPSCCPSFKCPKPGQCYSKGLDKFFDDGTTWTEPPCTRNSCVKGKVIGLPCGLQAPLRPGCQRVQGKPGAVYPACCVTIVCKCYSKALKKYFNNGDTWTEPPCTRAKCENGNVSALGCPLVKPGPGCVPTKGKPGASYPGCCPSFKCPKPGQCYSKGLDKFLSDGAKWTEPKCVQARCSKSTIFRKHCQRIILPSRKKSYCKVVAGKPGSPYPGCCLTVVCKRRRCYSKVLFRFVADGETWRQGNNVRSRCVNGRIVKTYIRPNKNNYKCLSQRTCRRIPPNKFAAP